MLRWIRRWYAYLQDFLWLQTRHELHKKCAQTSGQLAVTVATELNPAAVIKAGCHPDL